MQFGIYLIAKGGQIPLQALVLPLQGLHTAQIPSEVLVVERLVLLLDPVLRLVYVAVEALDLMGGSQLSCALGGELLQRRPLGVELLKIDKKLNMYVHIK